MIKIDLNYNGIIEETVARLKYISGKRAESASTYHRHTPCKADFGLLQQLLDETLAYVALRFGKFWVKKEMSGEILSIYIDMDSSQPVASKLQQETIVLLRLCIVNHLIYRWLRFTGLFTREGDGGEIENHIELIMEKFRSTGSLFLRKIHPF